MKDHKHFIIWLDYFNSNLSREEGRRIPLNRSVKNPTIDELLQAVKQLGYQAEHEKAKHPKRVSQSTYYVSVEKTVTKSKMIGEIARKLALVRGGVGK